MPLVFSLLVGGSEAGLGYLLGGINKLGGKALNKVLGKVFPGLDNAIARIALSYGGKIIAEGNEEQLQTILEPAFKKIALNIDADIDWEEASYAWLLGALSAAGYGGAEVMADFRNLPGVTDLKSLGNALLSYDPVSLGKPGPDTAPAVPKISVNPGKQPERQESLQPQLDARTPYFTSDTWTYDLDGLWTETDPDILAEDNFDLDIGEDGISDPPAEPLQYEDYLRQYLDGDSELSTPNADPATLQGAAPKSKEQLISELAPKISKPGITPGRAAIAAQDMYTEVEKQFGVDMDAVLEAFQPGQDPSKFLDGFRNAYLSGKMGSRAALENSTAAAYLTEEQRRSAYALGNLAGNVTTRETLDIMHNNSTIESDDLWVGKSLGAKAKNYEITLPNGEVVYLTEGSRITNVQTIAGKGRNRQIDEIEILVEQYGGSEYEWMKKKGNGYVDYQGESYFVELHWYEEPSVGKYKWKVKADKDGNWFIYED